MATADRARSRSRPGGHAAARAVMTLADTGLSSDRIEQLLVKTLFTPAS